MIQIHRARRLCLQALCCLDVQGRKALVQARLFVDDSGEGPEITAAAHELLREAYTQREESDRLLAKHARHWDLSRLALVDRNILRLATYELRAAKAPVKVVISEALKLAQEFSTAESPRFINGVLDAIAKDVADCGSRIADLKPQDKPAQEKNSTDDADEPG